jgi:hypothetical protein
VIQRADEVTEFLAIYWKDGRTPISKQVKVGLGRAFGKFDEYQLAKYDRKDAAIRLRDVMFLVHAKPSFGDALITHSVVASPVVKRAKYKRGEVYRHPSSLLAHLTNQTLATPDTWETQLSAGADKRETFERLLSSNKLGYMALLRNLRNMKAAEVDRDLVIKQLTERAARSRVLPFRFIAAQRACPNWVDGALNAGMLMSMQALDKLPGKTVVLVDVSGSMNVPLSAKSDLSRIDAAACLAVLVCGVGQSTAVLTFSNNVVAIDPRDIKGPLGMVELIHASQPHSNTYLGRAIEKVKKAFPDVERLIVVTDEQSHDKVGAPPAGCRGYMINVAPHERGVGHGPWTRINGFSESVVAYIQAVESA